MDTFDPNTSAAIVLGADDWPNFSDEGQALNGGSPFKNSGALANAFFRSELGFGLEEGQILDLFNSEASSSNQITDISKFLRGLSRTFKEKKTRLSDIFLFYVGHGDFYGSSNDLLMLVRDSSPGNPQSGIQSESLAAVLKDVAPRCRHVVILDCCWSGTAIRNWQGSSPAKVAAKKITDEFPVHGTALICSSSKDMPSMAPPEARFTLFTGAFFETLLLGSPEITGNLSAREVKELAFDRMAEGWPELATRPVVQGIERGSGDLSEKAYFPNPRRNEDLIDRVIDDVARVARVDNADEKSVLIAEAPYLGDAGKKPRPPKVLLGASLIALSLLIAIGFYYWAENDPFPDPWSEELTETAPPSAGFKAGDVVVVSVDVLNLRFAPGFQEMVVGQLIKGERYSVNEAQGEWLELFPIVDGKTEPIGWVHSSHLELSKQETQTHQSSISQEELNQALEMATAANSDRLLSIAAEEIGVREVPGPGFNPRIAEYNRSANAGFDPEDEAISWNSQFVGWVAQQAGYESTGSAQSRSWEDWGQSSEDVTGDWQVGCIMVAWRFAENDGRGTVGFYLGESGDGSVRVLSGNIHNAVDAQTIPIERVTACRLPNDYAPVIESIEALTIYGECESDLGHVRITGFHQPSGSMPTTTECVDDHFSVELTHEATHRVSDVRFWQGNGARSPRFKPLAASAAMHGMSLEVEQYYVAPNLVATGAQRLEFVGSCSEQAALYHIDTSYGPPVRAACNGTEFVKDIRFVGGLYTHVTWWPDRDASAKQTGYYWPGLSSEARLQLEKLPSAPPDLEQIGLMRQLVDVPTKVVGELEWIADQFVLGTAASLYVDPEGGPVVDYGVRRERVELLLEELCADNEPCWRLATQREFIEMLRLEADRSQVGFLGIEQPASRITLRGYVVLGGDPILDGSERIVDGMNERPGSEALVVVYADLETAPFAINAIDTEFLAGCDYNDCGFWLVRPGSQ